MLGWILINFILGRIIGLMWIRSIKKSTPESIIGGFPTNRKPPLSLIKQGLKLVKIKMGQCFLLTRFSIQVVLRTLGLVSAPMIKSYGMT